MCRDVHPGAVERAAIETRLTEGSFPSTLPYSVEQIFLRALPAEELPDHRKRPA
jgi:hypothetical protein